MKWKFIKAFPKYAIALGLLLVSTGLFGVWWFVRFSSTKQNWDSHAAAREELLQKKAATLPDRLGWLVLAGNDLYDISTGELIFKNWLEGMPPQRLFYQKDTNRLMAQYERGIVRFGLDGRLDGFLGDPVSPPAFTHDGKMAMFVKDGDVWIVEVDWKGFRFVNERQATRYGKFNGQYFAANTVIGSENALVVRNQPGTLRIDLKTGDLRQIRLPLDGFVKRRSPDEQMLIGDARNIYVYDVESQDAYNFPESRWRAVDFQWLDNERCAFIIASKSVSLYDRKKNAIEELVTLPFECSKIVGPSPDGRFVLCAGRRGILVLDVEAKTTEAIEASGENFAWVSNGTIIFTRNVPDSVLRGTWLKTAGQPEHRVVGDPYMVGRDGTGAVDLLRDLDVVVFATQNALFRMKPDGSELREISKLNAPVIKLQAVNLWGEQK